MKEWYVKVKKGYHERLIGPCASKEEAEKFAHAVNGELYSCDRYAREMIENSRNIIYRNQEGRTERERKRRLQRTWFLSVRLRWM